MHAAPVGMDWGDDGYIYSSYQGKIWRISSEGGEDTPLSSPELDAIRLEHPFVLPGSKVVLCNTPTAPGRSGQLHAVDLETLTVKDLEMIGSDPRYLPTGHLMFAQGEQVQVAPFDLQRLEFTGSPTGVHPRTWVDQGQIQMDVSAEGTVVYLPAARGDGQSLMTVDLDGKVDPLLPDGLPFVSLNDPRISRDGRKLLLSIEGGAIYMVDLDTQTPTLMSDSGFYPLWSPDGDEIVYSTSRGESFDIYRRPVDLSRPEEVYLDVEHNLRSGDWSPQGVLVIREEIPGKGMDLHTIADIDDPTMLPLLEGDDDELAPVVSFDGKWLAYVSNYSGSDEVYVTSFPEAGGRRQISIKGGTSPTWAPDGSAIYYFEGSKLIEVGIETEPHFRVTGRRTLFEGDYVQYRWSRQYDIHPDGKRFIVIKNPARGDLEVVTNWFRELRDLAD
jgi:hypothetical protein